MRQGASALGSKTRVAISYFRVSYKSIFPNWPPPRMPRVSGGKIICHAAKVQSSFKWVSLRLSDYVEFLNFYSIRIATL